MSNDDKPATDQETIERLKGNGVWAFVWKKTLQSSGETVLSEWISKGHYSNDNMQIMQNLFLYGRTIRDGVYTRTVMHLIGKEMTLLGDNVYIATLDDLAKYVDEDSLHPDTRSKITNALYLIVDGFYEAGCPFPFTARTRNRIRKFFHERLFKSNQGLILHSTSHTSAATGWWDESFLSEVEKTSKFVELHDPDDDHKIATFPVKKRRAR
jgi:hypothetical protein